MDHTILHNIYLFCQVFPLQIHIRLCKTQGGDIETSLHLGIADQIQADAGIQVQEMPWIDCLASLAIRDTCSDKDYARGA